MAKANDSQTPKWLAEHRRGRWIFSLRQALRLFVLVGLPVFIAVLLSLEGTSFFWDTLLSWQAIKGLMLIFAVGFFASLIKWLYRERSLNRLGSISL